MATSAASTTSTCPIWCIGRCDEHQPETEFWDGRHEGRPYTLDLGTHFAWTVTTRVEQHFDATDACEPVVVLRVNENEMVDARARAELRPDEVRILVAMLTAALTDLELEVQR
ncbi:MAG: DUF6907 domain-containing protein [Mycobacteriaceae bacterium]